MERSRLRDSNQFYRHFDCQKLPIIQRILPGTQSRTGTNQKIPQAKTRAAAMAITRVFI